MKMTLMGGASRFAHFAGLTRPSRRASDDDQHDDSSAEAEDRDEEASEEDDREQDGKRGNAKRGKAKGADDDDDDGKNAEDDEDGKSAEDDDDGKSASEDDDGKDADDDEDELKGKSATASARRREQARITHILTHKAAANNPVLALSLACDTRMTRKEAVSVLKNQPAAQEGDGGNRHARRERTARNVPLGSDASAPSGKQALDASWGAAFAKVGVKTR